MNYPAYIVGIDPGAHTGLCLIDREGKILNLETLSPEKAKPLLRDLYARGLRIVGVELNEKTHIYARPGVSYRGMLKVAQNVERNRATAREMIAFAEGLGMTVYRVPPRATKMTAERFAYWSSWTGRSSSHARDAWGIAQRTLSQVNLERSQKPNVMANEANPS